MRLRLGLGFGAPIAGSEGAPPAITGVAISDAEIDDGAQVGDLVGTLYMVGGVEPATFTFVENPDDLWAIDGDRLEVAASLAALGGTTESPTVRVTDAMSQTFDAVIEIAIAETEGENDSGIGEDDGEIVVPDPEDPEADQGGFVHPPITQDTSDGLKISGKNGGSATFIFDWGVPEAGATVTMRYTADWSGMNKQGREAAVGFGFLAGNSFHLASLRGNGGNPASMRKSKIYGDFRKANQFTKTDDGAAAHGTKDGPNWLQIEFSEDGETYTLRTSADGESWTDAYTDAVPQPLSAATDATTFGPAAAFTNSDKGVFSLVIEEFEAIVAPTITSSNSVSVAENATLSKSLTSDQTVTWSIVGGADQAQFEISGSTLRWASNGTQDYEDPADADTDNAYVVTVRATNETTGLTADQTITATVTDVAEGPTVTYIGKIENTTSGSLDIGPANGTRRVVMAVPHSRGSAPARSIVSGTIGGSAANLAGQTSSAASGAGAGILWLDTTGGGSTAMAVTFSAAPATSTLYIYVIDNPGIASHWDVIAGNGNNPSVTFGQPDGGVVIGCAAGQGANAFTWTGLSTEDDDTTISATYQLSAAHSSGVSANSSASVTATSATADEAVCVISFGGSMGALEAAQVGTYYEDTASSSTSRQFSSVDTGVADAGRLIAVEIAAQFTAAGQTFSSVTITPSGGSPISMTQIVYNSHAVRFCTAGIYVASVPTGTTGATINVSSAGTFAKAACSVHRLVGYSATAHDTDSSDDTATVTLDFDELGYGLIARSHRTGGTDNVWAYAVEDFDLVTNGNGNTARYSGAHLLRGAARTGVVITTSAETSNVLVGATFEPA